MKLEFIHMRWEFINNIKLEFINSMKLDGVY